MLLLNTRFAVTEDLTRETFINMFRLWQQSSVYADCNVPEDVLDKGEFVSESGPDDEKRKISIFPLEDLLGIVVESKDKGSSWKLTYGFHDREEVPFVTVTLDKTTMSLSSDDEFHLPGFLKQLFWNEYGGDDHGFTTDNRAIVMRKSQCSQLELFAEKFNPIVYVSCKKDGSYIIDYDTLAAELMGQAHVVVESSPAVADLMLKSWKEKPANGNCTIVLPNGESRAVEAGDNNNKTIIQLIRDCLNRGISYVFDPVVFKTHSLSERLATEDKELAEVFDAVLKEKDNEIEALKAEVERLRQDNFKASSKAESLQTNLESSIDEVSALAVPLEATEKDLYPNERKDVILKVLQKEYDSISHDANTSKSRKADVLKDVLEHNFPSGTDIELTDALRGALVDGALTKVGIGRLQSLGFGVKTEKNNHIRILFGNDPRYAVVVASTTSDVRSAKNCVSDLTRMCFK